MVSSTASGRSPLSGRSTGQPAPELQRPAPRSLGEALRAAGMTIDGPSPGLGSETPSEEDYDENVRPTLTEPSAVRHRYARHVQPRPETISLSGTDFEKLQQEPGLRFKRRDSGIHLVLDEDNSLQRLLKTSSEWSQESTGPKQRRRKFADLVFTSQFSAFDRHSPSASNSPFHGFYTLFWLAVTLFVFKISAQNWQVYGNPLGTNEIIQTMFHRDVVVLLLSDGVMCALTAVTWMIQRLVSANYLNWDGAGWVIQNMWQTAFLAGVVGLTLWRDWPWTHTVFFVLHGIVMLMKQHSYAFYNGHLSTVYKERAKIMKKLRQLDLVDPAMTPSQTEPPASAISTQHLSVTPSAEERRKSISAHPGQEESDIDKISRAIASHQPLDDEQVALFERIMKWEVDAMTDELKGTAATIGKAYPNNLSFIDHYKWIPLPTLVYEIEYPRSDSIDWSYVLEKFTAMFGVLFVMVQVSQHSIYPVVMKTIEMKENGVPLAGRFQEFPGFLLDLIFPFMMEYLLVWYLIWETILNILAELTYFADRNFYDAWWNSVSWDQFARDWNRPVHVFLLRHVYHSSISSLKVNKHTATLITFFLSACVHELVMWCLFKKLRGYLLFLQMCQLPLVRLSRTKWLRGRKTLGNLIFWLGIFTGPSLLCSLYLIL
ncbi:sterol O-acyltransferase [Fusarium oxysporum f. sp. raphani 54005]|uniref:Sterol O-acyltransferase n=5 Tax=Fusarium oxysporum TaxID=5507 RepID=X0CB79_FUSOX|nr:sterol O-acyltransferase [Fusarium oxysporum f. sp. pisi HDV247]EXK91385.1 sterol O-acyltransferase [Fusarium oxysporum f. sp. raphani 54005]EXL84437.1 sterol O-acyltransferase [Fusarium oxysporum f. sp. conglutinans race 2 54008]KAG6982302.1 Sterol O-acyltransferase 2 [Fusarium oxysporum f. sp. conglutinans]KAG7427668.1 Sterol O-acyltransferase 2 [Fusarium oxysporum f. sp. raphani]